MQDCRPPLLEVRGRAQRCTLPQASISDAGSEKPLGRFTHPALQRVYHLCDGKAVFFVLAARLGIRRSER